MSRMVKMINKYTGTEMYVANTRVFDYEMRGHKRLEPYISSGKKTTTRKKTTTKKKV